MFAKNSARSALLALFVLLVQLSAPAAGDAAGDTRVAFMQALMRAAFPALERAAGSVVISASTPIGLRWDAPFEFFVDVYPAGDGTEKPISDLNPRFLRGNFRFVGDVFEQAGFSGTAVNQPEWQRFDQIQAAGGVSTNQQLSETLARLDAKFGPDKQNEFTAQMNLQRFVPVLGSIEKQHLEFNSGLHADPSYNSRARWTARVRTRQGQLAKCFVLLFEPFGGQLEGLLQLKPTPAGGCPGL